MWLSTDLALGEYIPGLDKDKNKNLPGMGGLFNQINANLFSAMGNNPIMYVDQDGRFSAAVFPVPPVPPTGLKWDSGKTSPIGKGFIDDPPKDISLNLPDFKSYLNFMWSVTGPGLIKNLFEWIKKSSDNKKNSA